jgi:hypothetical protein
MDELDGFVMEMGRGLYRRVGSVSLDEAVARVRAAIAVARSNQARELLVDTTALTGFPSPDTLQRFLAAVEWAEEARGGLRLAMVARAEMIDPGKFGVTVAANRGLVSNIFTTEVEARAWLDGRRGPNPLLQPTGHANEAYRVTSRGLCELAAGQGRSAST